MEPAPLPVAPACRSIWRRFGGRLRARRATDIPCETCGSSFACPVDWSMAGESHWLVDFRCGECGAWMAVVLTNAQAAQLDRLLERRAAAMLRAAERAAGQWSATPTSAKPRSSTSARAQ